MSTLRPLYRALMERWKEDAGIAAAVGDSVFEGEAPQGTPRPFIVIATATEVPNNTLGRRGFENTVTAHGWAEKTATRSALDIEFEMLEAMNAALEAPLVLNDQSTAVLHPEFTAHLVERDGDTSLRHVSVRYRASYLRTGAPV